MPGRSSIAERPDQAVRIAFLTAWVVGMVALVGANATEGLLVLMLPAGLLITACGIVTAKNWHGVRDRLTARYKDTWHFRLSGKRRFTSFEGVLLTLIGLGWVTMGLAQFVKLIS